MVRSFEAGPLDDGLVRGLFEPALRAPSAGNTAGTAWVVLEGAERARYWELATTEEWQTRSRRFEGLSRAPVVALSLASPAAYVERYSEPDKAPSGWATPLGRRRPEAWPVPYWFGDAAFATMGVLLAATDAGLGAAFLGNFRHEHELLAAFGCRRTGASSAPSSWGAPTAAITAPPRLTGAPSLRRGGPAPKGGESAVGTRRRVIAPETT